LSPSVRRGAPIPYSLPTFHLVQIEQRKLAWVTKWKNLWYALTVEHGPWETDEHCHSRLVRDSILCGIGIPMRFKPTFPDKPLHDFRPPNNANCQRILLNHMVPMRLDLKPTDFTLDSGRGKSTVYKHEDIKSVSHIRFSGLPTAVDIQMANGSSILLTFIESGISDHVLRSLPKGHLKKLTSLTKRWLNHSISTFRYLLHLNRYGGHSFCAASQYPIIPCVRTDCSLFKIDVQSLLHSRSFTPSVPLPDAFSPPQVVVDCLYGSKRMDSNAVLWESVDSPGLPPRVSLLPRSSLRLPQHLSFVGADANGRLLPQPLCA
jgi:hypothetical protein